MNTNEENTVNEVNNARESNEMKELLCETLEHIKHLDAKIDFLIDEIKYVKRKIYYL